MSTFITHLRALIIEDEEHTRVLIRTQLQQLGLRDIAEAANGREGMLQVVRTRPHFILCDVHMDVMDGLEFLKTLRSLKVESVRNTPVIFLTADSKTDTVLFAKEHAVSGYLVKPVSVAQLRARIEAVSERINLNN